MPTKADYAKIHIALKELGLDDQAYRDILQWKFQVSSAKDLTPRQVAGLLNHFRAKGWRPKFKVKKGRKSTETSTAFVNIQPGPNAKMQRYILALWNSLGYNVAKLHKRCKKQFGVDRFEWLQEYDKLHVLIIDLQARCKRAGIDSDAG